MGRFLLTLGITICLATSAAPAGEAFPGQFHLAAGLACHRNLDFDCARNRLEQALEAFSPEADPNYMQHVTTARWVLTQIHVAADDLGKAERELKALLLLDPDFDLPPGDHPPKLRYVFEQAKSEVDAARKPDPVPEPDPGPEPDPDLPPDPEPPVAPLPAPPARLPFRLSAGAGLVALFGDDAEAASPGAGALLRFAWDATEVLSIDVSFDYAWHATDERDAPLQHMALALGARTDLDLGPVGLRLGGGLGVLATGTADRYDHWGFTLAGAVGLVWPLAGAWGLVIEVRPSVLVTAGGSSFYLPIGLSGEVRW